MPLAQRENCAVPNKKLFEANGSPYELIKNTAYISINVHALDSFTSYVTHKRFPDNCPFIKPGGATTQKKKIILKSMENDACNQYFPGVEWPLELSRGYP